MARVRVKITAKVEHTVLSDLAYCALLPLVWLGMSEDLAARIIVKLMRFRVTVG